MSVPAANGTTSYQKLGSKSLASNKPEETSEMWIARLATQVCNNLERAYPARGGWELCQNSEGARFFKRLWKDRWPLPEQSSAFYVSLRVDGVANEIICKLIMEEDLILWHRLQVPYDLAKAFLDGPEIMLAKVSVSQSSDLKGKPSLADISIIVVEAVQKSVALNLLDSMY